MCRPCRSSPEAFHVFALGPFQAFRQPGSLCCRCRCRCCFRRRARTKRHPSPRQRVSVKVRRQARELLLPPNPPRDPRIYCTMYVVQTDTASLRGPHIHTSGCCASYLSSAGVYSNGV
ncbi:hypothetical protein LY78DRAFT_378462 [Colletotrichum sublineola]|nr:hypothetical protein LY78DRAFT_378462 [Colletotrichum sublineola]